MDRTRCSGQSSSLSEHATVAWGRDYADVTPVQGVIFTEATKSKMKVSVDMAPLD